MGCSFTKDVESPCKGSKGTSWHKVMQRGVTIQVDPSLKTTDGGYIAAIFSANYGILRKPAPVEASEKNDSLQMTPEKGGYPQHKVSVAAMKSSMHSPQKTSMADTVLGVSVLQHTKNASESSAAHKSVEGTKEKLETINILELMADLAEDEVSTNLEQWHTNPEPSIQLIERHQSATVLSAEPSDETLGCRDSSGMRAVKRPRPKSFSSIKSVEDVDVALSTTRSKTPPLVKSSGESWPVCEHGRRFSEGSFHAGNGDIDSSACKTSSSATNTTDSRFDNESFRDPENLQRALSFKYMFNDNDGERQHFYIPDSSATASQINETNARVCSSDCLVFAAAARLLGEGDSNSASSSPAFSVAASLKDWLPSSNHPSETPDDLKGGFDVSFFGSLQSHVWEERQPDHSSDTRKMRPMYDEGVSNRFRSQCREGADNLFTRVEECEAPVFDPEMLDSFENAMKHLSKEDWDAVRSMEESPRNFLRLVKALKKSSSNSVRSQKAFGVSMNHDFATASATDTDSKVGFEPGKPRDSKLKKLSIEKKLFFMRQNSLEVEKTLARVRTEEDEERAVVFYSTTTRTDAKIYEDCRQVRGILRSLVGVCYDERSISELPEYEQELKQALNISSAIVPTIYAKGKYLVGADSIVHLYKQGMLVSMLNETAPYGSKTSMPCVCRGGKLLVCPLCKGTCKLSRVGEGSLLCRHCGGKGLIKCLNCSSG